MMYLDNAVPGKLLEIGCGNGDQLMKMRQIGWEVEGEEVDPSAADHARRFHGLKVHLGSIENANLSENNFDAIIMNHVIEHVYNPKKLLIECYRILKPNGVIVIVTPNTESLGHKYFSSAWRGLEPPRHLHLFSNENLNKISKNAGFTEVQSFSTAAKAGIIAVGSFDIKQKAHHKMGGRMQLRSELYAAIFHLWAICNQMVKNCSGEECVLIAKKTSGHF